jgi:APA family basic amino acid/polyamine antiporter
MEQSQNAHVPRRALSGLDGTLLVIGSMIGSGIFIVSADIARNVGSAGWLIMVWVLTGVLTLAAALSYGELAGMFPKAGGQYVYLREAWGKRIGFLYGWAFFAVIQTGTIAAVGVAFGKFLGYIVPSLGEVKITPESWTFSINASQLVAIGIIVLLTAINTRGVESGKWIGAVFTFSKIAAMAALIIAGFLIVKNGAGAVNWSDAWTARKVTVDNLSGAIHHELLQGSGLVVALCVAAVGSIFSSDAWNSVTFIAGEMKRPERNIGLSLFIGTLVVTVLYITMNLMYLNVLTVSEISKAPQDRVALAASLKLFGNVGTTLIAVLVMISTFGCNNGLILSGARVYNTMAHDGLFLPQAKKLNSNGVPAVALWMQAAWASLLCLSGRYGDLLDYIVFVALVFYILTIGGIFRLRRTAPDMPRPYKAIGYPVVPVLYIALATIICVVLLRHKPNYTWPGLFIVLLGLPIYWILNRRAATRN